MKAKKHYSADMSSLSPSPTPDDLYRKMSMHPNSYSREPLVHSAHSISDIALEKKVKISKGSLLMVKNDKKPP